MSGKEAKETLGAVGGLLFLIQATCLTENGSKSKKFEELFDKYGEAVQMASDAIDIMDHKLDIENKGDK